MIIEAEYTRLHCLLARLAPPPKLDAVGGWKETPLGLLRFDACLVLLTDDNAGAADTRRRTGLIFQQNVYLEMLMLTRGDDSNDIAIAVVTTKTTWRDMVEIDQQRVVTELERHRDFISLLRLGNFHEAWVVAWHPLIITRLSQNV